LKTQKRILRFAAFSLVILLVSLLFAIPCFAEEKGVHPILLEKCTAIEAALDAAFLKKADALEAEAEQYRQSDEPLLDASGSPLDKDAVIEALEKNAAALRTASYSAYRLAIVEYAYEVYYIDTFRPIAEVADQMTDFLAGTYDISQLDEIGVSDRLIICYMAAIGDKYASYYNEDAYSDLVSDNNANYSGIGVTVTQLESGYVEIIGVTEASPAEAAGLSVGDVIVAVEGEDFVELGYATAINKIRGEVGTSVTITVARGEERFDVTLTRAELTEYTVTYKMLNGGGGKIGYIRISQFDAGTFGQFKDAVRKLGEAGAEKYVFDVRNNPGGMLESVLAVLDYILPDDTGKPLIRMQYKQDSQAYYSVYDYVKDNESLKELYGDAFNHEMKAPIAVLCNAYTASAGELFTSCLKDFGVAEVFGTVTLGKGTGQSGFMLTDIYAFSDSNTRPSGNSYFIKQVRINVSTFRYAPPISDNYEGIGVSPHHVVELSEEAAAINFFKLTEENDNQLAAAIAYLNEKEGTPYDPSQDQPEPTKNVWSIVLVVGAGILFIILALIALLLFAFLLYTLIRESKREKETRSTLERMRRSEREDQPPTDE